MQVEVCKTEPTSVAHNWNCGLQLRGYIPRETYILSFKKGCFMKLLHTSDWHLGRRLVNKSRETEHELFLEWLLKVLREEEIDVLIVAGDVFDCGTPPNSALQMYYNFLRKVTDSCCEVIVTGGNHDSPATLNAPKELLKQFRVHVFGAAEESVEKEVVVCRDRNGKPNGIVCAVPFLRDRDVRKSAPGESYEEKSKALLEGVKKHYQRVAEYALRVREETDESLPIVGTGHLYAAGGVSTEGVREIYVGALGQIHASSFPDCFDYLALGHLHIPQSVGKNESIRYCGSPIPMSFGEVARKKEVVVVDCDGEKKDLRSIDIPVFQRLVRAEGTMTDVAEHLKAESAGSVWAEVKLHDAADYADPAGVLRELTDNGQLEILSVKTAKDVHKRIQAEAPSESLEDLTPEDVFRRRLQSEELEQGEEQELVYAFREALEAVHSERNAS